MESVVGEGSAFTFTLPVAGPDGPGRVRSRRRARPDSQPEPLTGRDLVVIVEDDPRAAKLQSVAPGRGRVRCGRRPGRRGGPRGRPAPASGGGDSRRDDARAGRLGLHRRGRRPTPPSRTSRSWWSPSSTTPCAGSRWARWTTSSKPVSGPRLVSAVARRTRRGAPPAPGPGGGRRPCRPRPGASGARSPTASRSPRPATGAAAWRRCGGGRPTSSCSTFSCPTFDGFAFVRRAARRPRHRRRSGAGADLGVPHGGGARAGSTPA